MGTAPSQNVTNVLKPSAVKTGEVLPNCQSSLPLPPGATSRRLILKISSSQYLQFHSKDMSDLNTLVFCSCQYLFTN